MPYKDQTNITINKQLREQLYKIKDSYSLTWDQLFKEMLILIGEEQNKINNNETEQ